MIRKFCYLVQIKMWNNVLILVLVFKVVAAAGIIPDVVVALDSSGQFSSIGEAVNAAPVRFTAPFTIYVKAGVYYENVEIPKDKWNIVMIGDGADVTVIASNRSNADGFDTLSSATFSVKGFGFIGRDISFVNTAGPEKQQGAAFFSDADQTVLYRCSVRGYQDTLYAYSGRHFYKRCYIEGTVDFIFGRASAVFQDCQIVAKMGLPGQKNTITAQGRENSTENSAFSLQFCDITVTQDVLDSGMQTYLGRPWKLYSTVVVMESTISGAISPQGWLEWDGSFALDTLYFGEFMNSGLGYDLSNRVGWSGYHMITDPTVAFQFTVFKLIQGDTWLPLTGIEYISGLERPEFSSLKSPKLSGTESQHSFVKFALLIVGLLVIYIFT